MSVPTTFDLELRLKTLWGASSMPFASTVSEPYAHPGQEQVMSELRQLLSCRSSGVLHGANGVGKTVLLERLTEALPDKLYSIAKLTHTTLSGSDLLRVLGGLLGIAPRFRRSDVAGQILAGWEKLSPRHPVLIVDEAQNLSAPALEELRLLYCSHGRLAGSERRAPFSLLLVGDEDLIPRLQMGVNRPLQSRLGFCLQLHPFTQEQTQAYVEARWREVGVAAPPLEPAAVLLLHQASGGIPRTLNNLSVLAITAAAQSNGRMITGQQVQTAMGQIPWLTPIHE